MNSDPNLVDLSDETATGRALVETSLNLTKGQTLLRLRLPAGTAGRAEVLFAGRSWAAKHYWQEARGGAVVYEFDEPLPEGAVLLRVPFMSP